MGTWKNRLGRTGCEQSAWYVAKLDRVAQRLGQTLREDGPRNGQALAILLEHVFERIEQVYADEKVR